MTTTSETAPTQPTQTLPDTSASDGNVVKLPAAPEKDQNEVVKFVKEHPVITIAGGLALGALAAALIPGRNRRYIARRSSAIADTITAASMSLASQAMSKAELAGAEISDTASKMASRANRIGHNAGDRVSRMIPSRRPKTLSEKLAYRAGKISNKLHR